MQIKFEFGSDPLIFHEVMALRLRKKSRIVSFPDSLSLLTNIHLIFGVLFCHTKLQIKFKFVFFYPFEIHEVMVNGLRKIFQIVSFLHFVMVWLICANLRFVVFVLSRRKDDKTIIIVFSPRKDDKSTRRQNKILSTK
jgi:Ca2+/Na+ antiporter